MTHQLHVLYLSERATQGGKLPGVAVRSPSMQGETTCLVKRANHRSSGEINSGGFEVSPQSLGLTGEAGWFSEDSMRSCKGIDMTIDSRCEEWFL